MRGLTETRMYWAPCAVGVVASLVVWGISQTPVVTGDWFDLVWLTLMLAVFGAVSVVAGGTAHATWGGALAGLAGLVISDIVINLGMGSVTHDVLTVDFAGFLSAGVLALGVPYLLGYFLARAAARSVSSRDVTPSRA